MSKVIKNMLAVGAALLSLLAASCGGGSGAPNPPAGGSGPAPGTADLQGQLVQGARSASAVGDGMSGIPVTLIDSLTGALLGSSISGADGRFEFKAVPSGTTLLLKIEFNGSVDLDGDGAIDEVEMFFPLSLADQSITEILQQIGLADLTADSQFDTVNVKIEIGDDNGRNEVHHRQHRHRDGRTFEDSNRNGVIDDSDRRFDDGDCDGLPDGSGQFAEREVFGTIEALGEGSIAVNGVTFTTTTATEWQVGENHHASPSQFSVGQAVKVEGFVSASGELIAREVKDRAALGNGGGFDDNDDFNEAELIGTIEQLSAASITVGGITFAISPLTEWQVGENHNASPAQFSVGQRVKIEGFLNADGSLTAREVKDEAAFAGSGPGGDDDGDGDGNSGPGDGDDDDDDDGDDDDDDDNSGPGGGDDDD